MAGALPIAISLIAASPIAVSPIAASPIAISRIAASPIAALLVIGSLTLCVPCSIDFAWHFLAVCACIVNVHRL